MKPSGQLSGPYYRTWSFGPMHGSGVLAKVFDQVFWTRFENWPAWASVRLPEKWPHAIPYMPVVLALQMSGWPWSDRRGRQWEFCRKSTQMEIRSVRTTGSGGDGLKITSLASVFHQVPTGGGQILLALTKGTHRGQLYSALQRSHLEAWSTFYLHARWFIHLFTVYPGHAEP